MPDAADAAVEDIRLHAHRCVSKQRMIHAREINLDIHHTDTARQAASQIDRQTDKCRQMQTQRHTVRIIHTDCALV